MILNLFFKVCQPFLEWLLICPPSVWCGRQLISLLMSDIKRAIIFKIMSETENKKKDAAIDELREIANRLTPEEREKMAEKFRERFQERERKQKEKE